MNRSRLALTAAVVWLAASPAVLAQPARPVTIQLMSAGLGRTLDVQPTAGHVCTNSASCPDRIRWTLVGSQLAQGERILIAFSDGTAGADRCMDATSYAITSSPGSVEGQVRNCLIGGKKKAAWLYDVCCVKDAAATDCKDASKLCDNVDVVDPGMIIGD